LNTSQSAVEKVNPQISCILAQSNQFHAQGSNLI